MKSKLQSNLEKFSVKLNQKWFKQLPKTTYIKESQSPDIVLALKAEAENLLDSETKLYHRLKENKKDNDFIWIKQILRSGTLSDKVSAHTLLIQDSPVYNISSIEALLGMVNTKGKRECLMAMEALKDLFIGELLVDDKKLRPFNEQPLKELDSISKGSPILRKRILILWLFEDSVKSLYKVFLNNLQTVSHDTVEKTKQKAVTVMYNLLKENPEQEQYLLEHLVNKIGDPSAKVGSHVCYTLLQLLTHHPVMKGVVVQEVERLIFRPNLAERAKYYSLCFLNQIILSHDEYELANNLIMVYFSQFKLFVKKGEVNTKMMSALLTGVARAYPFAKLKNNVIMDQLDSMYRLVHLVSFNISIQALMLIFQVLDSKDSVSDRFYSALYRKLFDPALNKSSRQSALLNLMYKALKKDVAVVRVKAFVKRLLQVSLYQAPNLQCGILMLISEVCKIHPSVLEEKHALQCDSDSEEYYEDLPDEDDEDIDQHNPQQESGVSAIEPSISSSWVHVKQKKKSKSVYDFNCRNPLHSGAEFSNLWELLYLKASFHPSVSLFAHQICNSTEIKYSGDPLLDFTTARFLDRFVYRNPKKQVENFQRNSLTKVFGGRKLKKASSKQLAVTSSEYLQQHERNIPAEEQFIYRYLQQRTVKVNKDDSDIESICSDDFQKLLDQVRPEDESKDSLNFAKELGLSKSSKRKAKSDSDIDSLDSVESGSDMEYENGMDNMDFDEDKLEAFGDLEETNNVDADLCEDDFVDAEDAICKKPSKKKKTESLTDEKLFASAEEFSALLEDNAGNKVDTISSEALENKDKAGAKQLAWEMKRHRYVKGNKWQNKKRKFRKNVKGKK